MKREDLQKAVLGKIGKGISGRILLAPRSGKTKIIIDLIKRDEPCSILWVSPSRILIEKELPSEFIKWGARSFLSITTFSTWTSLHKVVGEYGLIILDEEQFITEKNSINLRLGNLRGRIISMTGTPTKHKEKRRIYNHLGLRVLYRLSIERAVDLEVLSNYELRVIGVKMSLLKTMKAGTKAKPFKTSEYSQYLYLTKVVKRALYLNSSDKKFKILERMRFIKNSPSKLRAALHLIKELDGRKLIFCASIKQSEILNKHTYNSSTNKDDLTFFQNKDIENISMVNSGGIGATYRDIDHLILVQTDSDKNGLTSQKIARTLLVQKDYKAKIWIICLEDTQDEKWVNSTLENFNSDKIRYLKFKDNKICGL